VPQIIVVVVERRNFGDVLVRTQMAVVAAVVSDPMVASKRKNEQERIDGLEEGYYVDKLYLNRMDVG